ncbi:peroxiredoxin family protein, partial [Candidatus Bathyarchaeota archaeon]|nr:peroxiredoxin family protein [Candidatus Bathyarchaeota archaeon]
PAIRLPSNKGTIDTWNFKHRKNLVVIFHHGKDCQYCRAKLQEIAKAYDKIKQLEAEVIAISFDTMQTIQEYASADNIPFPLLSDVNRQVYSKFTCLDSSRNAPCPSIFITDRFCELRFQEIAREGYELPDAEEILSWLLFIETECPECSHL